MQDIASSDVRKLAELIKGIKIAMLVTADPDGAIRSRPMMCQDTEFDGDLWFFTEKSSGKTRSIENDQRVNVSFAAPEDFRFVSVHGVAKIVDDPPKKAALWKPVYKAWFPKGLEDPDLVLLKVSVEGAEYWDTPSGKLVQLMGFAKTLLTGRTREPGRDEHAKLDLRH